MTSSVLTDSLTYEQAEEWLVNYLSLHLNTSADEIDIHQSFQSFGMDSASAIGLTGDLAEWTGLELEETTVYDYPTIAQLAKIVSQK